MSQAIRAQESALTLSTYVYPGASAHAAGIANRENQFLNLSTDVLSVIFSKLLPQDLAQVSDISWRLHNIVSNERFHEEYWKNYHVEREFPAVKIIDETVWRRVFSPETLAQHGLSFDDADPQDPRAIRTFLKGLDFTKIEGTEANTGVTLLTIPKGLTFNKLVALAGSPREGGRAVSFRYVWDRITQELGDTPVAKAYRVAISNNILKESRSKTYDQQQQMAIGMGGQMPEFLPTATLCGLTYMMSALTDPPTRLFNDNPLAYTRCVERVDEVPLVVGGFAPAGLRVGDCFGDFGDDYDGVGFMWKF